MASFTTPGATQTTITQDGTKYSYVWIQPKRQIEVLLFLHGFPSSTYDWRRQIDYFSAKGFGILAPDLVGYGGTDKPISIHEYALKKIVGHVVDLLDTLKVPQVHGVAHDWGSHILSRLANYHPGRLQTATFLAVPYSPPGLKFDVDILNALSKSAVGYERFGYFHFFLKEEAADIIEQYAESFYSLFYPEDPVRWRHHLAPSGAIENWLHNNRRDPLPYYLTQEERQTHFRIFQGKYGPALNWYRSRAQNIDYKDELENPVDPVLDLPVLVFQGLEDRIALPQSLDQIGTYIKNPTVLNMPTGHWIHLEATDTVNQNLEEFIFASGTL